MKGIGYIRVSRVGPRDGDSFLSPQLQMESIERVCQREGIELVDVTRSWTGAAATPRGRYGTAP